MSEIIEAVKDGEKPDYEELYWTVLALSVLWHFDHMELLDWRERSKRRWSLLDPAEESFRRAKQAMSKSPKEWVGPNNDPANPRYQRFRSIGKKLVGKILTDDGGEDRVG